MSGTGHIGVPRQRRGGDFGATNQSLWELVQFLM